MRLIDADALGNRMYHESFEKDSDLQRWDSGCWIRYKLFEQVLREAPTIDPTHPTQLTDEDKETIRIHLSAFKERLCNQHRWNEAKEYEELISRLLSTPSVQPEQKWETCFDCPLSHGCPKINGCTNGQTMEYASDIPNDCPISIQPRKGKWLKAGTRMGIPLFECSLCECAEEVPTVMGKPSYNFCPNCGCRMGEGDSDENSIQI